MKKTVIALTLIMVLVMSMLCTACGSKPAEAPAAEAPAAEAAAPAAEAPKKDPVLLRLGHEMPEEHPYHEGAVAFKEKVAELTDGAVEVEIFANGTLGKQAALLEGLTMGTVDLAETNTFTYETYCPEFGVITTPFVFRDQEHAFKCLDGEIGDTFKGIAEEKGIKVLAWFRTGEISLNSSFPIEKPEDVKGRKIRIQNGRAFTALGDCLEMIVTPTAYSELYSALQLGTVEGAMQPAMNIYANKFYEHAKYYADMGFLYTFEPLAMSVEVYNKLPAEYQEALQEAADYANEIERQATFDFDEANEATMVAAGYTIIKNDREAWIEAVQPMYEALSDWQPYFDQINAVE